MAHFPYQSLSNPGKENHRHEMNARERGRFPQEVLTAWRMGVISKIEEMPMDKKRKRKCLI
jgi:hypothetical protein